MNKLPFIILTCMFILFSALKFSLAQGQPNDKIIKEKIDNVIQKLNMKILLDENQRKKVKVILMREFANDSIDVNDSKKLTSVNDKIDALLTERQKNKFKIIKTSWLNELINPEEKDTSKTQ